MGWTGALGEGVVAGIGEVVGVGVAVTPLSNGLCDGVVSVGSECRCVGDWRHAGFFALLPLAVDEEEEEEEEDEQHQHDDARDHPDLVGVHR